MHEKQYHWSGVIRFLSAVFGKKFLLPFLLLIGVFFASTEYAPRVFASTIYQYLTNGSAGSLQGRQVGLNSTTHSAGFKFAPATTYSGITAMEVFIRKNVNHSADSVHLVVYETVDGSELGDVIATSNSVSASDITFYDDTYPWCTSFGTTTTIGDDCLTEFTFNTSLSFSNPNLYIIQLERTGGVSGTNYYYFHSRNNSTDAENVSWICEQDADCAQGDAQPSFVKMTDDFTLPDTFNPATRVSTINFPAITGLYVSSTTAMYWDIDYVSGSPTPVEVCLIRTNLTTFQNLFPMCEPVIQSGFLNFATSTVGTANNLYTWKFSIRGANNQIIDETNVSHYSHGEPYSPYDPEDFPQLFGTTTFPIATTSPVSELTLECDPDDAFFARSICNLALILFSPSPNSVAQLSLAVDNLKQKAPFSTATELKLAWANAERIATTTAPLLDIHFLNATSTILSEQNLNEIGLSTEGTTGVLQTLRYLIVIAMWLGFAWFCFIRVSKFF